MRPAPPHPDQQGQREAAARCRARQLICSTGLFPNLWFKVLRLMLFIVVRYSNSGVPHLRDPGRKLEGKHKRTEFGGPIGGSDGRLSASQKPLYNRAQLVTTDSLL